MGNQGTEKKDHVTYGLNKYVYTVHKSTAAVGGEAGASGVVRWSLANYDVYTRPAE